MRLFERNRVIPANQPMSIIYNFKAKKEAAFVAIKDLPKMISVEPVDNSVLLPEEETEKVKKREEEAEGDK